MYSIKKIYYEISSEIITIRCLEHLFSIILKHDKTHKLTMDQRECFPDFIHFYLK